MARNAMSRYSGAKKSLTRLHFGLEVMNMRGQVLIDPMRSESLEDDEGFDIDLRTMSVDHVSDSDDDDEQLVIVIFKFIYLFHLYFNLSKILKCNVEE